MRSWGGGGSGWHLVTGHAPREVRAAVGTQPWHPWWWWAMRTPGEAGAVVGTWSLNPCWWQWFTPTSGVRHGSSGLCPSPGVCAGCALPPESGQRKKLLWRSLPSPCEPPSNGDFPVCQSQSSSHTPFVVVHHTLAPSGCLHAANPNPFPRSDLRSPSLSTQPHPTPVDERLRLGSAGWCH